MFRFVIVNILYFLTKNINCVNVLLGQQMDNVFLGRISYEPLHNYIG